MTGIAGTIGLKGRLHRNLRLAPFMSWRVGGPADRAYEPVDRTDLLNFLATLDRSEPLLWIGLGSNLLVRDGGFRGTAIVMRGALNRLVRESAAVIYAESGTHCARLSKFAERQGLAGLGFMAGIPGTVGGALAMNAGAWGSEIWTCVMEAEIVDDAARTRWLIPTDFCVSYRSVVPPDGFRGFLAVRLKVTTDDGSHALATREWLARRRASQPVGKPSAGSTFRNPPGDHAARLIDSCGLKGRRVGDAVVSERHANFIINLGNATAADIEALIEDVRDEVKARTGVRLETEVHIVGEAANG